MDCLNRVILFTCYYQVWIIKLARVTYNCRREQALVLYKINRKKLSNYTLKCYISLFPVIIDFI